MIIPDGPDHDRSRPICVMPLRQIPIVCDHRIHNISTPNVLFHCEKSHSSTTPRGHCVSDIFVQVLTYLHTVYIKGIDSVNPKRLVS